MRRLSNQKAETKIGRNVLGGMSRLGMPDSIPAR
jgi:hypothetical protein